MNGDMAEFLCESTLRRADLQGKMKGGICSFETRTV